ncbi:hypothetical protein Tco_1405299 [Tanacetum coccineum]
MENLYLKHGLEGIDYAAGGRIRKLRPDEAFDTIERLAQYENERWNDTFTSDEVKFGYENPNVEQLLGIMEHKVDTLMKDAISLMGNNKGIFQLITNEMCQPPTEPSRQEEFEHIVTLRIKEMIKENQNRPRKVKKITKYPDTKVLENSARHNPLENLEKKTEESQEARDSKDLEIGGEQREISLLEFGWRIGLYSQGQAIENTTLGRLRNCNTVREDRLLMEFWPRIGNGRFNVGNIKGNEGEELSYGGCLVSTRLLENSLIAIWVIMELHGGMCVWPRVMAEEEEDDEGGDEGDEGVGGDAGRGEAGGSADLYRNMSQGDCNNRQFSEF